MKLAAISLILWFASAYVFGQAVNERAWKHAAIHAANTILACHVHRREMRANA